MYTSLTFREAMHGPYESLCTLSPAGPDRRDHCPARSRIDEDTPVSSRSPALGISSACPNGIPPRSPSVRSNRAIVRLAVVQVFGSGARRSMRFGSPASQKSRKHVHPISPSLPAKSSYRTPPDAVGEFHGADADLSAMLHKRPVRLHRRCPPTLMSRSFRQSHLLRRL